MRPARTTRRIPRAGTPWLALSEASALLGISPATLRRWSDAGRVASFTTPGGHRRFSREALERLLPSGRDHRPPIGVTGAIPTRIARAYRGHAGRASLEAHWMSEMGEADRTAFRERGRLLTAELLAHLDAPDATRGEHHLREAASVAAEKVVRPVNTNRCPARLIFGRSAMPSIRGALRW